ncbi:glycosyl hydrolase [Labilibacter sediminis]|nr:glycosyl hydrolase [Labilibacter sediminis]
MNIVDMNLIKRSIYIGVPIVMFLASCTSKTDQSCCTVHSQQELSASMQRYKTQWENKEPRENEFYSCFKYKPLKGLEYEEGISRRDPSTVIKVADKYYVYYTRSPKTPAPVGYKKATESLPANTWDLCDIYYATSTDGETWEEQGVAAARGPEGEFDDRSVFTPDIMVYEGKYYLYYQAVKFPYQQRTRNVIGMSWANSPDGPWHRNPKPVLEPGEPGVWDGEVDDRSKILKYGAFDSHKVHDPNLIIRDGKIWMYYKAHPMGVHSKLKKPYPDFSMGVAISDTPEGPFVKHHLNPISASGHEALVWPYKDGVASLITANGPEKNTVQWAKDGVNFEVKAHVVLPPDAAGLFCPDKYDNTKNGKGFTWGLCHIAQKPSKPWAYLMAFECDLSSVVENSKYKKENIRFDEYSRVNSNRSFHWKK